MSKKVVYSQEDYEDDLSLYTSESKENSYETPRGMGLDLTLVDKSEYLEDDSSQGIQETPIMVYYIYYL